MNFITNLIKFNVNQMIFFSLYLGHKYKYWPRHLSSFFTGYRRQFIIINLNKTFFLLKKKLDFNRSIRYLNGNIGIINNSNKTGFLLPAFFQNLNLFYSFNSWLPGFLTNYRHFSILIKKKKKNLCFKKRSNFNFKNIKVFLKNEFFFNSKSYNLKFLRYLKRIKYLKKSKDGLIYSLPKKLWVLKTLLINSIQDKTYKKNKKVKYFDIDIREYTINRKNKKKEKLLFSYIFLLNSELNISLFKEISYLRIPHSTLVDSDCPDLNIDYKIPANDDNISSILFILILLKLSIVFGDIDKLKSSVPFSLNKLNLSFNLYKRRIK